MILIPFLRRFAAYGFICIVILVCAIYLSGCAEEEPLEVSEKTEPAAGKIPEEPVDELLKTVDRVDDLLWRVTIEPESPKRNETLVARMIEAEGKPLYKWYVNGKLMKESSEPVFSTDRLKKGDSVNVTVVTSERVAESEDVLIVNAPPVIRSALLLPSSPVRGDTLSVDLISEDADGDMINLQYKWMINDSEIEEDSDTLQASLKSGDRVSVVITPSDDESTGSAIDMSVTIGNSPPVVSSGVRELSVGNGLLTGRIEATDPDGDDLSFRLLSAPQGLKIDKAGMIIWSLPEKIEEKYPVSISVSDEYGGESTLNFELSLNPRQP